MLIGNYIESVFLVVACTLGIMSAYFQVDAVTRQRVAKQRDLGRLKADYPLVVFVCLVLLLLGFLSTTASHQLFWVLINLQAILMLYSNLLLPTLSEFLIIQGMGALMFFLAGDALNWVTWLIFLVSCLVVYSEHWYSKYLVHRPYFFLMPPLIIGVVFWARVYVISPSLTLTDTIVNYIGFAWAYYALWVYDQSLQRDQQVVAKLTHEVQYDGLTRVRNWAMFRQDFTHNYGQLSETPQLALVVMDIDHFKHINDTYGHLVGNQVLMMVATQIQSYLKRQDPNYKFYRTGGEEFAMILPGADLARAKVITLICHQLLSDMDVRFNGGEFNITASFGLAMATTKDGNSTAVFKRADHYLYQSKHAGRDCITVEGETLNHQVA
ncbi:GGDEF domain-containing protein [Secundilactobacillus similis DSM 23365 = JCM 2765]|uniref:Signal transduction diguanylate cyclase n=1 Tax=Secundilactobacillus similis DSM 23365 = JCM 2765 TaxID=1423804 RepID=A0A0R2EZA7_9LACO|nr:GGDEF domain-containing protein [Secundilactobacillus similis]KRN21705.1 Signal transduction diguanylate cyclase [Secundilactobacillus similis DSM 23365 = JCM 2765]